MLRYVIKSSYNDHGTQRYFLKVRERCKKGLPKILCELEITYYINFFEDLKKENMYDDTLLYNYVDQIIKLIKRNVKLTIQDEINFTISIFSLLKDE